MRKRIVWLLVMLLISSFAVALIYRPARAQEGGFTETFDDENLEGWERSDGSVVQNGVLRISPGHHALKLGDYVIGDLSVKVKHGGSGAVFIRYHMRDESSYGLIILDDLILLEKVDQGQPKELGSYPRPESSSDLLQIQITVSGGQHQVVLDGETIIEATDPAPLQAGSIGFMTEGESVAEFDDLAVIPGELAAGEAVEGAAPVDEGQSAQPTQTAVPERGSAPLGLGDLIAELTSSQANPLELSTFIVNLLLSVVLSYILSRVYVHWGSSLSNRRRFAANFILITVTTTFIILVVRSSVALSLGLVGALSIVRFRAAIKEPEELAYLFFAISIGIGLGDNQRIITILAMAVAIIILGMMRLFRGRQADFNLHVTVASHNPGKVELETIMEALSPHCAQIKLMRFDDSGAALESSFLVEFRNMGKLKQAKAALRSLSDSLEITFLDNKGIW